MRYLIISAMLLAFINLSYGQKNKIKYSKARISYNTPENFAKLLKFGVPMDHGNHKVGVFLESDFSSQEIKIAEDLGISVEILIDDVQKFYVERNQTAKSTSNDKNATCVNGGAGVNYPQPVNYNHGSMGGYLTYSEVMQEIDSMTLLYPNLVTARAPISTFTTYEGRSLYWVRMSDNPNTNETEPEVLYDAVHHAREPMSIQQMVYYMWYLLENYATNTEVQAILDNTELYFVPFVNPDGYLYNESTDPNGGGMWRKNRRDHSNGDFGVDPNRNYDYTDGVNGSVWGTNGISFNTNSDVYCGSGAFSEPEIQAMKWFVEQHDFKLALNNHSYGELLLLPFGFDVNQYPVDYTTYVAISDLMVSQNNYANQMGWQLYAASGVSDDWMYGETASHNKIFSFTPEIGPASQGFWPPSVDINNLCNDMVYLNLTTAHLAGNYAKAVDKQPSTIQTASGFLKYDIQRLGMSAPGNFTVSIIPVSTNIASIGSSNSHNGMNLIQIDSDSISYTLGTISLGDIITYVISVNNGLYTTNDTISKIYGTQQVIFNNNGNSTAGWNVSQTWGVTTSEFYSPSSSIADSPSGNYGNSINKTITLSNPISLNNALGATMSFWAKWAIEDNWDYVQVEVSTDNGSNWIPQCGNYTQPGSSNQVSEPLYDGFQNTWVKEEISLSDYLGQNILVRFQIVSDGNSTEDGFYYDDFEISVIYGPTAINELTFNGAYVGQNMPNPTNSFTAINYFLPSGVNSAELNIANEVGQIVFKKSISAEKQSVKISTENLSAGVYYYFIDNAGLRSQTKKMVIVD
jgi:carboxypeptidase T